MDSKARKLPLFYYISIFTCLVITASALVLILRNFSNETSPNLEIQRSSSATSGFSVQDRNLLLKQTKGKITTGNKKHTRVIKMSTTIKRLLSGPGSSPPRCIDKCEHCSPCKPVFVSVPPRTSLREDYYPEVWKCKCGNKLYKP